MKQSTKSVNREEVINNAVGKFLKKTEKYPLFTECTEEFNEMLREINEQ